MFRSRQSEVTEPEAEVATRPSVSDRVVALEQRVAALESAYAKLAAVKELPEYTRQKLAAEAEQAELERAKAEAAQG